MVAAGGGGSGGSAAVLWPTGRMVLVCAGQMPSPPSRTDDVTSHVYIIRQACLRRSMGAVGRASGMHTQSDVNLLQAIQTSVTCHRIEDAAHTHASQPEAGPPMTG
jgi:hypothetical protein